jgi:hypothetical protein
MCDVYLFRLGALCGRLVLDKSGTFRTRRKTRIMRKRRRRGRNEMRDVCLYFLN